MSLANQFAPILTTRPTSLEVAPPDDALDTPASMNQPEPGDATPDAGRNRRRPQWARNQEAAATRTWLADDPRQWAGRKVRSRKNGATYTIRQVFKNERVELEKSWMTYASDVPIIRADYETCV